VAGPPTTSTEDGERLEEASLAGVPLGLGPEGRSSLRDDLVTLEAPPAAEPAPAVDLVPARYRAR
jgi:hypothetical protein